MKFVKILVLISVAAAISCTGGKTQKPDALTGEDKLVEEQGTAVAAKQTIVFMNTDTIMAQYKYADELMGAYRKKAERAQKQLETKQSNLENTYYETDRKAKNGLMTQTEMLMAQDKLQKDQAELEAFVQRTQSSLAEEQMVTMNKISYAITEYVKKYNEEKGYTFILTTNSMTSTVLVGDPAYDITHEIIEGLNKEHAEANKDKNKK